MNQKLQNKYLQQKLKGAIEKVEHWAEGLVFKLSISKTQYVSLDNIRM